MALVFQYRLASHVPGSTTTTGNAFRGAGSFSPTGRYVLFDSSASNLAGSDSNASSDLFLYDTQGTRKRSSCPGAAAGTMSSEPSRG